MQESHADTKNMREKQNLCTENEHLQFVLQQDFEKIFTALDVVILAILQIPIEVPEIG